MFTIHATHTSLGKRACLAITPIGKMAAAQNLLFRLIPYIKLCVRPRELKRTLTPTFALSRISWGAKVFPSSADAISVIAICVHPVVGFDNL
jgi:hypothetical protein